MSVGKVKWNSPSAVELTSPTPAQCRAVMDHQLLREIRLNEATSECVEVIFQRVRKSLMTLCVYNSTVTTDNMATLSTSLVTNIQQIDLLEFICCDLGNRVVKMLSAALHRDTSLLRLSIECGITDTAVQKLSTMLTENSTLVGLSLTENSISAAGVHHLSTALCTNTSLLELNLCYNNISDKGAEHLATVLMKNNTLQDLILHACYISDSGVAHLSSALQHNTDTCSLSLANNKGITDAGAVALSGMLKKNKTLKDQNLQGTSLGEEGAGGLINSLIENMHCELLLPPGLQECCEKHSDYYRVKHRMVFIQLYV